MNKKKILDLVEKDFLTIANLERSIRYALQSNKDKQYQFKIIHAASSAHVIYFLKEESI